MCCCPRKGRCGLRHWPGAAAAALGAARAGKAGKAKAAGRVAAWGGGGGGAGMGMGLGMGAGGLGGSVAAHRESDGSAAPEEDAVAVGVECGLRIE